MNGLQCRGSMMLGSGCGSCDKCQRELQAMRPIQIAKPVSKPEIRLCKDCKHYDIGEHADIAGNHYFSTCRKSRVETIDLVSGETVINHTSQKYCHVQRMCSADETKTFEICGEEGRWWEAK